MKNITKGWATPTYLCRCTLFTVQCRGLSSAMQVLSSSSLENPLQVNLLNFYNANK